MSAREFLGSIIALKGAGMAAGCAGLTGLQSLMNALPILRPICWGLAAVGLLILLAGLLIAAIGEESANAE